MMKLGAVFIVHIDGALAIGSGKFRLPRKSMLRARCRRRRLMAVAFLPRAVESENVLGDGLVKDGVGIAVGLDVAADGFSVFRSKMVTSFERPLLVNPRPRSEAMATPWTPWVWNVADNGVGIRVGEPWCACRARRKRAERHCPHRRNPNHHRRPLGTVLMT